MAQIIPIKPYLEAKQTQARVQAILDCLAVERRNWNVNWQPSPSGPAKSLNVNSFHQKISNSQKNTEINPHDREKTTIKSP